MHRSRTRASEQNMRWSMVTTDDAVYFTSFIDKCALNRFNIEIKAIREIIFSFSSWCRCFHSVFCTFRDDACVYVCVWVCLSTAHFFQGVAPPTATLYDCLKRFAFRFAVEFNLVIARTGRRQLLFEMRRKAIPTYTGSNKCRAIF